MSIDKDQLAAELNASFSTLMKMQAWTASVTFQQLAKIGNLGDEWVAEQLHILASHAEGNSLSSPKPDMALAYAEQLRSTAAQLLREGGIRLQ